jgi:hypothetical protein
MSYEIFITTLMGYTAKPGVLSSFFLPVPGTGYSFQEMDVIR